MVNGDEAAEVYFKNQDNTSGAEGGTFGHLLDNAVGGNPETDKMEKDEAALFNTGMEKCGAGRQGI